MISLVRTIISEVTEGVIKRFSGAGRPGETFTDREFFQQYGFTSRPLSGAEGLVLMRGNQVFLVATDDRRYRIEVQDGEVALYTDEGDCIHMKRGREIAITAGAALTITAPSVTIAGDLAVTGNVSATGTITDTAGNTNHHTH